MLKTILAKTKIRTLKDKWDDAFVSNFEFWISSFEFVILVLLGTLGAQFRNPQFT